MKITLYAMALFSAFFVSSQEPDLSDLKEPSYKSRYLLQCGYGGSGQHPTVWSDVNSGTACQGIWNQSINSTIQAHISSGFYKSASDITWTSDTHYQYDYVRCKYGDCATYGDGDSGTQNGSFIFTVKDEEKAYQCPPDGFGDYTVQVPKDNTTTEPTFMCAKPLIEPTDNCDEFGNNSFLPPNESLNVPAGGSVCYTTSGGSQCQYKKNPFGSGFEQTGQQCTGEETPYPKPDLTPPDNPDDPNACATVGAVDPYAVCPVNPNDVCNRIIVSGDGGDKIMNQCPAGCGSVDGQYVCAYPDKNGDGIPDENQDPQKGSDTKDPNDPNDETPDATKTNNLLYGLDKKLGVGNSRLTGIKTGIEGMTKEQMKGNGSLSAIASNTAKTANNTLSTAGSTADILTSISETDVSNTFNPESSASFYESEYENGFAGVWEEKSSEFQQTEAYQFLQQFKFNGGGAAPDTSMCFNLGQFMDFGCSELPVPDAGLLAILKVFILISAAFLCRRLIFGG